MRRFNYTGRRRVNESDIVIQLIPDASGVEFECRMDVRQLASRYRVPDASILVIEAYNRTKYERFDYGSIGSIATLSRRRLKEFGPKERVLFRVKAVEPGPARPGRIVAMASGLVPVAPADMPQRSLLPVSVQPLDHVIWLINFDEDDGPTLVLNEALDTLTDQGIKQTARTPVFLALVYPQVIREILTHLLIILDFANDDSSADEGAEAGWRERWFRYAKALNPEPLPDRVAGDPGKPTDLILDWIDTAVAEAARRQGAVTSFRQWMAEQS